MVFKKMFWMDTFEKNLWGNVNSNIIVLFMYQCLLECKKLGVFDKQKLKKKK